ncbi:MAG: DUF4240 domain-containing protein [Kineosporiaceae bacterium]
MRLPLLPLLVAVLLPVVALGVVNAIQVVLGRQVFRPENSRRTPRRIRVESAVAAATMFAVAGLTLGVWSLARESTGHPDAASVRPPRSIRWTADGVHRSMGEDQFWALIAQMHGDADQAGVASLVHALDRLPAPEVAAFQERLASVLFDLDRRDLCERTVRFEGDDPGSPLIPLMDDSFLYLRAGLVARGRDTVAAVLANPRLLDEGEWPEGESLLYVAEDVLGGRIETEVSYETGSNEAQWGRQAG